MDEAILQGGNWRASDFIVLISLEKEDFQNFVDDFGQMPSISLKLFVKLTPGEILSEVF